MGLKITAYADRLLDDLQELDWPDSLKKLQVNWIGKSEGAMIDFKVKGTGLNVSVFTTRPDTIYGVSFIALAPEHPLASGLLAGGRKEAATLYIKEAASKSDLERTDLAKEKTGVFTGSYAIHPITGKEIPIWVADFVLTGYGTGAVMAVPGHDERDFEFAGKFRLPVTCVIKPNIEESEEKTEILEGVRC